MVLKNTGCIEKYSALYLIVLAHIVIDWVVSSTRRLAHDFLALAFDGSIGVQLSPKRNIHGALVRHRLTERAGRTMTLTKPALRSSLGDEHFKQACWVAFNSPGFHELDIMALVKRWKRDGHLSAVMKDEGALRAREVLERKAREHKVSFLVN